MLQAIFVPHQIYNFKLHLISLGAGLALALSAQTCLAAQAIEPVPASIDQWQQEITGTQAHASWDIQGKGANLAIRYSSLAPIDIYILSFINEEQIDPRDILFARLPANEAGDIIVPLSSAPGWKLGERHYRVHFLTTKNAGSPEVHIGLSGAPTIISSLKQFFSPEPFIPSSYHRMRGYRFFGLPVTLFTSILLIILFAILVFRNKFKLGLLILLLGILIYNARFSLDELRYAYAHTNEWLSEKTYGVAGSAYEIAEEINLRGIKRIRICSDGTSYFPTLLQYAAYPALISDDADHVIVRDAYEWSYENEILKCGSTEQKAVPLEEFPDGAVLFSLESS